MLRLKEICFSVVILASANALIGCDNSPGYSYRYRLTIEVESNGQIQSGSSVVEVSEYLTSSWSLEPGLLKVSVTGDATVIDIGPGRVLVALLEGVSTGASKNQREGRWVGQTPTAVLMDLYGLRYEWKGRVNEGLALLATRRGAKELRFEQLPKLVTFRDIDDPKSLVSVDPNNLSAALGPDVRWKRATIEVTDAAISTGIEAKLPWLQSIGGKYIGKYSNVAESARDSIGFHGGQFRREKR